MCCAKDIHSTGDNFISFGQKFHVLPISISSVTVSLRLFLIFNSVFAFLLDPLKNIMDLLELVGKEKPLI